MSAVTPRPERVTLSDEELVSLADLATHHPQSFDEFVGTYRRLLGAREQALREEVAREQAALVIPPGSDHFQHGYECGLLDAVSITLSGPR